jgi:hypothetical protein
VLTSFQIAYVQMEKSWSIGKKIYCNLFSATREFQEVLALWSLTWLENLKWLTMTRCISFVRGEALCAPILDLSKIYKNLKKIASKGKSKKQFSNRKFKHLATYNRVFKHQLPKPQRLKSPLRLRRLQQHL